MNFSFVVVVVVFVVFFPLCCLAGHTLLGSPPGPSNANYHQIAFGHQISMQKANDANFGHLSMPKLKPSKSLKISSKMGGEGKNGFLSKMVKPNVGPANSISRHAFPHQQRPLEPQQSQQEGPVPFALYWQSVLDHFDGKVPAQTISTILGRLITALRQRIVNNDFDVITSKIDLNDILTPDYFFADKTPNGTAFNEAELCGHIDFIVQNIGVPKNVQLAYMSPAQLIRKTNFSTGEDIVWALGVMLFTMLTDRHPFQVLSKHLNLAQQNGDKQNANTVHIGTLLAESTEDLEPKWREIIGDFVRTRQELPIHLLKSPSDVGHGQLFLLLERCLQIRTERRISFNRLSRALEEIVEENKNAE